MRAARLPVLLAATLVAAIALGSRPSAASEREEAEPRLVLPGDRSVQAGEWIELRWSDAEDIRELEILLSVDGGRTYSRCITPQLDPDRRGFRWRVPALAGGELRLRIRYNRDGREIEGAPAEPLEVTAADPRPVPLGLPFASAEGEDRGDRDRPRAPDRSPGRSANPAEDSDEAGASPPETRTLPARACPDAVAHPSSASHPAPFAAPRMPPLRT
jgi:hypothetical protein